MMNDSTKEKLTNMAVTVGNTVKTIFTPARLKKAAALGVLLAVMGGAGKYYMHQQKAMAKEQANVARNTLMKNMAEKQNVKLVSEEVVKANIAEAMSTDAGSINFRYLALKDASLKQGEKERDGHKDKYHKEDGRKDHEGRYHVKDGKKEHKDKYHEEDGRKGQKEDYRKEQGQNVSEVKPLATAVPASQPEQLHKYVYQVKCNKDKVDYSFLVDGVSGNILRSKVND